MSWSSIGLFCPSCFTFLFAYFTIKCLKIWGKNRGVIIHLVIVLHKCIVFPQTWAGVAACSEIRTPLHWAEHAAIVRWTRDTSASGFHVRGGGSQVNSWVSPPTTWRQHNDISLWGGCVGGRGRGGRGAVGGAGLFARCIGQEAQATTRIWRGTLIWTDGTQAELKVASSVPGECMQSAGTAPRNQFSK